MLDPRLHIWPRLAKDDPRVLAVKEVVIGLKLGTPVKPFWWTPGVSVDVDRVLVLDDGFEYGAVVDYIHPKKKELIAEAVKWTLGIGESRGARDSFARLSEIFPGITETTEEAFDEVAGIYA